MRARRRGRLQPLRYERAAKYRPSVINMNGSSYQIDRNPIIRIARADDKNHNNQTSERGGLLETSTASWSFQCNSQLTSRTPANKLISRNQLFFFMELFGLPMRNMDTFQRASCHCAT